MCGIYGLFSLTPYFSESSRGQLILKILKQSLHNRGPDSSDTLLLSPNLFLGHTRLSINDLSGGNQPFRHSSDIASSINGEIYNYHALIGHEHLLHNILSTRSDCEIIGALYSISQNINYPFSLARGMYASAVADSNLNKLFLSRDFFGEKPLFVYEADDLVVFSSSFKSLYSAMQASFPYFDKSFFADYMLFGYPVSTILTDRIFSVKAGFTLSYSIENGLITKSEIATKVPSSDPNVSITDLISRYIDQSSLSDVPLAIGLSGGKDSCLIASSLHKNISRSFTVGYESQGGTDEIAEAEAVSHYLGIPHTKVIIKDDQVPYLFKSQAEARDLPSSDMAGIGYYSLYEKVKEFGYKVVLMGHGGDELFMGYEWLFRSYTLNRLGSSSFFYEPLPDHRVYVRNISTVLSPSHASRKWHNYRPLNCELRYPQLHPSSYATTLGLACQYWLEPNSLRMGDSLSMNFSLEARHPLLSSDVAYQMSFSDNKHPLQYPKYYLSSCLQANLPSQFIQKEKKCFSQPYMKYYFLIHKQYAASLRADSLLLDMGIVHDDVYNHLFGNNFASDGLTYYYFCKFASLEFWLRTLS